MTLGLAADSVGIAQAALNLVNAHAWTRTITEDQKPLSQYQTSHLARGTATLAGGAMRCAPC